VTYYATLMYSANHGTPADFQPLVNCLIADPPNNSPTKCDDSPGTIFPAPFISPVDRQTMISGTPANPAYYDLSGQICQAGATAQCPFLVFTQFHPYCQPGPRCAQADRIDVTITVRVNANGHLARGDGVFPMPDLTLVETAVPILTTDFQNSMYDSSGVYIPIPYSPPPPPPPPSPPPPGPAPAPGPAAPPPPPPPPPGTPCGGGQNSIAGQCGAIQL
jgi:hypothetical protein